MSIVFYQKEGETTTQRNARILREISDQIESGQVLMTNIHLRESEEMRYNANTGAPISDEPVKTRYMTVYLTQYDAGSS